VVDKVTTNVLYSSFSLSSSLSTICQVDLFKTAAVAAAEDNTYEYERYCCLCCGRPHGLEAFKLLTFVFMLPG